jgi:gluconate 2-dehydrogenase alpha chain
MATKLKSVDVVTIGVGLTGTILAQELASTGLKVVGIERGRWRDTEQDFAMPGVHDELKYVRDKELMQDLSKETITFRNNASETALPMRLLGSFLPGEGVGGAAVHWGGLTWRFLPWDFETKSQTLARYGAKQVSEECTLQDWGVTYADLEPHFNRFEYLYGVSGKAGNLNGKIIPGGNPFEGARSQDYPNPPLKTAYSSFLFKQAVEKMGFKPFPVPTAANSRAYKNEYGQTIAACVYCGYCQFFACEMGAKGTPQTAVLPVLMKNPNYELRTLCNVTKINLDSEKKRAVSVTYVDSRGREFEQPADLILLTSYVLNNTRLMLLSGIGKPYDPVANTGVVGRNYAYQTPSSVTCFFDDKNFNSFMGAGGLGIAIDEFNGDNFDHSGLGFIGGGFIQAGSNGARPIEVRPVRGTPRWGSGGKGGRETLQPQLLSLSGCLPGYRGNYRPGSATEPPRHTAECTRLSPARQRTKMSGGSPTRRRKSPRPSAVEMNVNPRAEERSSYQSTHNTGGTVMGADPATSVVNKYLQSWDVHNLFVVGAGNFPQNGGYNPTGTVGALTYQALEAIKTKYLKKPGALV